MQCPKCFKQVPDQVAHCGYCGAPLRPTVKKDDKRTLFGYSGMSQPQAPAPPRAQPATTGPRPAQPARVAGRPQSQGLQPAARTAGQRPMRAEDQAKTLLASPGQTGPPTRGEAMAPTQFGSPGIAEQVLEAARARGASMAHSAARQEVSGPLPRTIMQQGMPAPAALRRSEAHPVQSRDPSVPRTLAGGSAATPAARQGMPPATVASESAAGGMIPATRIAGTTDRPEPSRPVLASESLAEDRAPAEPGRTAMRLLMAVGGLLLLGIFVAPLGRSGAGLAFTWDLLPQLKGIPLASRLLVGADGVLFLAAALLPIPFLARALAGAILGLIPLALTMANGANDWRYVATVSTLFLLPAALLHRWWYRGSVFARLLVGACVLAVLATLLVPAAGSIPLIQLIEGLGSATAASAPRLLLLVLALLSLLALLGSGSTGLAQVWAIALLFYLPLLDWLTILQHLNEGLWVNLAIVESGLSQLTYLSLCALGLSQIMAAASRSAKV